MKELRVLLLGLAICLASGVKAQFYDSADDIYYYVECNKNGGIYENGKVLIFNFDGKTACELTGLMEYDGGIRVLTCVDDVKEKIMRSQTHYEDKIENTMYNLTYESNGLRTTYTGRFSYDNYAPLGKVICTHYEEFVFSTDRMTLEHTEKREALQTTTWNTSTATDKHTYKKVDKSFFKVGRSRTPSSTMHE